MSATTGYACFCLERYHPPREQHLFVGWIPLQGARCVHCPRLAHLLPIW